ncbi:MAG: DUF4065 domain-containing protein [Spirochaetia bacterium]|jgi:uncharacterized phage-associated protein|nr:DUF4065 domain-containing protein [Spirochaetia bacterium]
MLTVFNVADYFLSLVDTDSGDNITNLKLQKLVYYAQGFHLAMYNKPLFAEEIQAWEHGPVVPVLYQKYKKYGSGAIPVPTGIDFDIYSEEQKELFNEVYNVYGQYSAWRLRDFTHEEPPWRNTNKKDVITHGKLKKYFDTQLVDDE